MIISEKLELVERYKDWLHKDEEIDVYPKDCALNVINFLDSIGMLVTNNKQISYNKDQIFKDMYSLDNITIGRKND